MPSEAWHPVPCTRRSFQADRSSYEILRVHTPAIFQKANCSGRQVLRLAKYSIVSFNRLHMMNMMSLTGGEHFSADQIEEGLDGKIRGDHPFTTPPKSQHTLSAWYLPPAISQDSTVFSKNKGRLVSNMPNRQRQNFWEGPPVV